MHNRLLRFTSNTVAFFIASALVAACGGTGSVPTVASGASQTSMFRSVDLGALANSAGPIGNETMTSSRGKYHCTPWDFGYITSFNVKGAAQGPYPGKFQASGYFMTCCGPHLYGFSESFTITSHANTIMGSFVWNRGGELAFCNYLPGPSTNFTYTATLTRGGKVIKQFAGSASESGIGNNGHKSFRETLI